MKGVAMRMAKCPQCGGHNVNNYKHDGKWDSKCYDCGYTTTGNYIDRKFARYAWNRNFEEISGDELPPEMTGRMPTSFTRKEKRMMGDGEIANFLEE